MIAKQRRYFQENRRRYGMLKEARAILQTLGNPAGAASDREVVNILMTVGLGHLRAIKIHRDLSKASQEMERRIKQGPRPTYEEAQLN